MTVFDGAPLTPEDVDAAHAKKVELARAERKVWAVEDLLTGFTAKRLDEISAADGCVFDVKPIGNGDCCLVVWYRFE